MELITKMLREDLLKALYKYANHYYLWGASGPLYYDCSGLIYNILATDLKIGPYQRLTAQGYYNYFKPNCVSVLPGSYNLGDLAFFGVQDKIHHVALCLDPLQMFEAANGGPSVTSEFIAKNKGAYVTINPINRLSDLFAVFRPP